MDDNLYYKSMRKSYYQLARYAHSGYLEIHLITSLDKALENNRKRE